MSVHVHQLEGCRPSPLAHYLKALAVLRLVGEQADPSARGFWRDDVFHLVTTLDRDALETFFLEKYEPTPMIGPWNGGSGFYEGDSIDGRDAIRSSSAPRFARYREAIEAVLQWPELPTTGLDVAALCNRVRDIAAEKKGKARDSLLALLRDVDAALVNAGEDEKELLLHSTIESLDIRVKDKTVPQEEIGRTRKFLKAAKKVRSQFTSSKRRTVKEALAFAVRRRLPDQAVRWLDAALVMHSDGQLKFPPLLGSGGNEGRLDYTNAFTSALKTTIVSPEPASRDWLRASLWATQCAALAGPATGQFDPGRAGGFNQGAGLTGESGTNPWDYVLNLEGTIVWASSASRVGRAAGATGLSSPFTVRLKAVGYSSSSASDEQAARAEIWAPLWPQPVGHAELATFIAEARAQVGRRHPRRGHEDRRAQSTTEFAEAASSLGVARGVAEFARFALLKRRGDSYVALPTGRFSVYDRSDADLIRGLDPILVEIDAFMGRFGKVGPPGKLSSLRRSLDNAMFAALSRPSAQALQDVLLSLGRLELFLAQRDRAKKPKLRQPLWGLSPRWLLAADDGSLELRIAASLSALQSCGKVGPLRANLAEIDPGKPWVWAKGRGQVAWTGASVPRRLASVLRQRMMDAERLGSAKNPLYGLLELAPADIVSFIAADVDDTRIEELLFGLSLVDWGLDAEHKTRRKLQEKWGKPVRDMAIPSQLALLKLVYWPNDLPLAGGAKLAVVPEPSILPLLLADRADEACRIARRRLFASGLAPVDVAWPQHSGLDPIRLAAALLLPFSRHSLSTFTRSVLTAPAVR